MALISSDINLDDNKVSHARLHATSYFDTWSRMLPICLLNISYSKEFFHDSYCFDVIGGGEGNQYSSFASYLMDSYAAPNPTDSLFRKLRINSTQFFEFRDESILIFFDNPTAEIRRLSASKSWHIHTENWR